MAKRMWSLIVIAICIGGISFSTGCIKGPGEIQQGKATNADYGDPVGDAGGEELPRGLVGVD